MANAERIKERVNISIDTDLLVAVDDFVARNKTLYRDRSQLIERALMRIMQED